MNQPNNPCPTCGQYNNIICSNSYHLWVEPEIETDSLHVGETIEEAAMDSLMMDEYDTERPYTSGFIRGANLMKDKLSEAGESKWIDVKDRLPELGIKVLVHFGDIENTLMAITKINNKSELVFQVYYADKFTIDHAEDITHWQPLPSAPNETNVSPRLYTHEQVLAFGEKAFKAGGEFVNECFCGECDYCMEAKDKAPDFNTWVNQIKLKYEKERFK